ncbi:MAG: SUMF1/EgtB/PvdO family nonheme iron enzyme [Thermodesulfobacteriota bacterium]
MIRNLLPVLGVVATFLCSGVGSHWCHAEQEAPARSNSPAESTKPSRIFEGISGYLDGMRGGTKASEQKSVGSSEKHGQRRDANLIRNPDTEQTGLVAKEKELARLRMQRHEWDLAVSALERALQAANKGAQAEEANEIREMLQEVKFRVSTISRHAPSSRGEIVNAIGMKLVVLPEGEFVMGSAEAERRRVQTVWGITNALIDPEGPAHIVKLSKPFAMGKYEVTAGQFKRFVEETGYQTVAERQGWGWVYDKSQKHWVKRQGASWMNPGFEVWSDHPVTMICHQDAEAFCQWLSKKEGRRYYLPTEAQWEYAARGGKHGERFPFGNDYPDGGKLNMADYRSPMPWADRTVDDGNAGPAPVGSYVPNGFWLYDMAGNVWELCSDYYDGKAYEKSASQVSSDPTGPRSGKTVVVRGGNWAFGAAIARSSFRTGIPPDQCTDMAGFRVAADAMPGEVFAKKADEEPLSPRGLDDQKVSRILARVKELVASGKRLEARRAIEQIGKSESSQPDKLEQPSQFVREVLETVIDLTKDKSIHRFTNSLGMDMVQIPAGAFGMGSSEADIAWAMSTLAQGQTPSLENEFPFHKVRITRPFFISATEVTVGQFQAFVDDTGYVTDAEDSGGGQVFNVREGRFETKSGSSWKNPGWTIAKDQPVTMVSYNDAQAFVEWLSAKEKLPYKLPTEAQWEYACRGGMPVAQFPWGDEPPDGRRANYADRNTDFEWRDRNSDDGYKYVAPVGSYEANGFGLYDMAGNVLEWVRDYYGEDYYRYAPEIDPEGPGHGEYRVTKGGEWTFGALNLRCAFRGWSASHLAFYNTGFRVAIETASPLKIVHFAEDFLTKKWVPESDHRHVAEAVAKEQDRKTAASRSGSQQQAKASIPEGPLVRGVKILDFSPKSDAKKAGLEKGDIIIEYNGIKDLTADKLLALNAQTRKERIQPEVLFVRDGYQYTTRVPRGFLGISMIDTSLRGPFKRPVRRDHDDSGGDGRKSGKPLDWT